MVCDWAQHNGSGRSADYSFDGGGELTIICTQFLHCVYMLMIESCRSVEDMRFGEQADVLSSRIGIMCNGRLHALVSSR